MEGCLYKNNDNKYYLINTTATYNHIAVEFETFSSCFIQNENLNETFTKIKFSAKNMQEILDSYDEFNGYIDYSDLNEFNHIAYYNKIYIIRNWTDVYNFVAGRI
jgi:hypothetical protein